MRTVVIVFCVALLLSGTACRIPDPTARQTAELEDIGSSLEDCLARHRGRPVLIAFIAGWGATGLGPKYALNTPEAMEAMRQHHDVPVIADVTRRRDLFAVMNREFHRPGPPFIVLYSSDRARKPFVSEYSTFITERDGKAASDGMAVARIIRGYL